MGITWLTLQIAKVEQSRLSEKSKGHKQRESFVQNGGLFIVILTQESWLKCTCLWKKPFLKQIFFLGSSNAFVVFVGLVLSNKSAPRVGVHDKGRQYSLTIRSESCQQKKVVELDKEGVIIYPKEKAAPIARPSAKLWKASPSTTFDLGLFAKIWFDNMYTMRAEEGIEDSCEVSFWNILYVKGHHQSSTRTWSSSEVATLGQWEVYLGGRSPTLVSVNVVFSSIEILFSSKDGMYLNSWTGFSAFLTLPWLRPWPNRLVTYEG